MIAVARKIDTLMNPLRRLSELAATPMLLLAIRLYMANVFFKSGWLKFENYLNHDWGATVFLFKEVHPLPGIPPETAAVIGTAGETILPILLALGLFGRFAAAGLIIMTAVIQFGVPASFGLMNEIHYLWMMLLAVPFFCGPGKLSVDFLILRLIRKA